MQLQAAGLWPSQPPPPNIEDVFSCFLYTGNSSTQTITNNIDLSTKGGLVWIKRRTSEAHYLFDTSRGVLVELNTDGLDGNQTKANSLTSFNTTGFSLGSYGGSNYSVAPDNSYVSWTFREQPKFFDIVTWTGNDVNGRTISHALGSTPGTIIVKCTSDATTWTVYHRSLGATKYLALEETSAAFTSSLPWNNTEPTSSVFSVGTSTWTNATGRTYVAYLFAHNAGGFGLTETDNVISCGSFTTDGSGLATVSLGYEPQWVLFKQTDGVDSWYLNDTMRGMSVSASSNNLSPNSAAAESAGGYDTKPTATGFNANSGIANKNYIYIAIRRGPMAVPTTGTSVFTPVVYSGNNTARTITAGFPIDAEINIVRDTGAGKPFISRLTGGNELDTTSTAAEGTTYATFLGFDNQTGMAFKSGVGYSLYNSSALTYVAQMFRRAPSVFDVVCYTGTGVNTTQTHNLAAVPELMLVKRRSQGTAWFVYDATNGPTKNLVLNTNAASVVDSLPWNDTAPTSSVFSIGNVSYTNGSGATYVAYLFATCAGVSKVGSYTGTGTTQTINCGFTAGSRFVLIKRTDSTGGWHVWDSARGIVAGADPYSLLNDIAAEVTGTDYVDTANSGFEISSTAPAAINASGGTYIFLAIA
jgi:hypothetical protein